MRIEIKQPYPERPLVWVHVPIEINAESAGVLDILTEKRITILGRWEPHIEKGTVVGMKTPALLEDEHVKPRKTRTTKK
jgi:hypothetical protein